MTLISIDPSALIWALFGGILPSLLWLWFWLKEDAKHPEPKRLILGAFIAGMVAVPLAFFAEKLSLTLLGSGFIVIVSWAAIEEILKYGSAYIVAFRGICLDKSRCVDEPIDPLIYMITVALGFAALENTLFLLNPLNVGDLPGSILTGNLRFLGATLLHTLSSGVVGAAMAFSFYKSGLVKKLYVSLGLLLAIVLHSVFNFIIIMTNGEKLLAALLFVWAGIILLILLFEKVKRIKNPTFFS